MYQALSVQRLALPQSCIVTASHSSYLSALKQTTVGIYYN